MRWLYYILGILLIIVLAVAFFVLRLMIDAGAFTEVEAHFDGACERFGGFAGGTEDLQIDHNTGWVFVSSDDRRAALAGNPVRGEIQAFRLAAPGDGILDLTPSMPEDFHPHGISLYSDDQGTRLFVISHPASGAQEIVIFDVTYNAAGAPNLAYAETITDPLIVSPNDLVAVGPRSFYVGNDASTGDHSTLGYMLELYARINRTTVVYFDGSEAHVAARGLTYANGINVSPDGRTLYVAETTDGTMRVFDRNIETGELTQRTGREGLMRVGTGLDNIDIDTEGRVWIAAHPKLFAVQPHMQDPANLSPAQVQMIDPDTGEATEVYLGNGVLASGSSVGAYMDGMLVIGVIFDKHVVLCDVNDASVTGN